MSKKDYILIAKAFAYRVSMAENFSDTRASRLTHLREIADTLCERFAHDNSRFDRSRFMTACGFAD